MTHKITLSLIIILAWVLRTFSLDVVPPALYWDEVGLGYNAYSILKTGKDEHDRPLPLDYFLSFRDYKPPVYIYATVPFIAIFGVNEWAVRLPSATAGTFAVLLTFLLTKELISRSSKLSKYTNHISLAAALLMAISPWAIQTSRAAYEANIAQCLTVLGIFLFLKAVYATKTNSRYALFISSAVTFALTIYTFNANRVFTPLIILFMVALFGKELFLSEKHSHATQYLKHLAPLIFAGVVGLALISPLIAHLTSPEGQLRYKEVNIFSDPQPLELSQQRIDRAGSSFLANIFNNRRVLYTQEWLSGYFSHFRGDFLFIRGDVNPRFSSGDVGQLYLITLPFILIGLYIALTKMGKFGWLIVGWLLLAPVPAAFAREVPHALRTLHILPTFDILAALGFVIIALKIKERKVPRLAFPMFLSAVTGIMLIQTSYFLYNYFTYYPKQFEDEWQYGYKPMVQELVKLQNDYDRVIITNAKGRAYINTLFYQAYDPAAFQKERQYRYDELGLFEVSGFKTYEFRGVDWLKEITSISSQEKVLIVGVPTEVKIGKWTKSVIKGLNGIPEFIINEVPQGVENATEQNIYRNLNEYNAYHGTNYGIDKENNWIEKSVWPSDISSSLVSP